MSVDIHKIRTDGGTQSRAALNEATVAEYAEAMADERVVFPPITVYFDGKEYWLADGFHRVAAWALVGREDIPADVRQGDRRQAILHSVAANSAHGLRRTNEDKRRAVLTLLDDAEWAQWSDREIARRCAVSAPFVATMRAGLTVNSYSDEPRAYTTKHGTTATMQTANIGAKAEQVITPKQPQEPEGTEETVPDAPDPSPPDIAPPISGVPDAPAEDPETAKARRALAKMDRVALEDEVLGLRADLADEKAKRKALKSDNDAMKAKMADLEADDKNEVVRRLQKSVAHMESQMWRANEETRRAMAQVHALKKRVAELEGMGIAL